MQPIHYSLLFNIIALLCATFLAWMFKEPLLILVVLLVAQHTLGRFSRDSDDDDEDDGPGMGFTAKL